MAGSKDSSKIEFANSLRGVAALTVVAGHHFGMFWNGRDVVAAQTHMPVLPIDRFPTPDYTNWIGAVPFIHWSVVGVALFFLVSGFVIPFSFQKVSGPAFLVGRVLRLFPTFAAAISATLFIVFLGTEFFNVPWPYTLEQIGVNYFPGVRDLTYWAPIDGVVWTLEVEVKFYLVCAVIAPLLRRHSKLTFLIPVLLFIPALFFWSYTSGLKNPSEYSFTIPFAFAKCAQYIVFMFIGVAFHYSYMGRMRFDQLIGVTILMLGLMYTLWVNGRDIEPPAYVFDYVLALAIFGACMKFRSLFRGGRLIRFFADISYPLYVCHCIAGYVALRVLLELGLTAWAAHVIVLASVVMTAWLIHVTIEKPSHRLGRSLMARLSKSPATVQEREWSPSRAA
ncbi:acyltransferase family protein [Bradyrhizobium liaoningense]|uniref:acyltransferase family protein n=1 Tax=Bradyrhizobium liaoningense TaxID=43992 RepID=UPI0006855BDF|nr:acyltransferase [Bradyrhizobium liaoningense]